MCAAGQDLVVVVVSAATLERTARKRDTRLPPCAVRSESILPYVKSQVESQIRVRDFSECNVSIHPANFATWEEARATLSKEASRRIKAQYQAEIAANAGDADRLAQIEATFKAQERNAEHDLLHKPMDVHMCLDVNYNFLAK